MFFIALFLEKTSSSECILSNKTIRYIVNSAYAVFIFSLLLPPGIIFSNDAVRPQKIPTKFNKNEQKHKKAIERRAQQRIKNIEKALRRGEAELKNRKRQSLISEKFANKKDIQQISRQRLTKGQSNKRK